MVIIILFPLSLLLSRPHPLSPLRHVPSSSELAATVLRHRTVLREVVLVAHEEGLQVSCFCFQTVITEEGEVLRDCL